MMGNNRVSGICCRGTKGNNTGIVALRNSAVCQLLESMQTHYRHLGSCSVNSAFDYSWKEEVDSRLVSVLVYQRHVRIVYSIGGSGRGYSSGGR